MNNTEEPNETPDIPENLPEGMTISVGTQEETPAELNNVISHLLSRALREGQFLPDDARGYVHICVVDNNVWISSIVENQRGEFRFGTNFNPEVVMDAYHMKHRTQAPDTGSWFSVVYTVNVDGTVENVEYNYDKEVFTGDTPEKWFTAPEDDSNPEHHALWDHDAYLKDLERHPRSDAHKPVWL